MTTQTPEKVTSKNIPEFTMDYSEDGKLLVKTEETTVINKGAWSTVAFKYAELNKESNTYNPSKYSLRRFQKKDGKQNIKSKFNITVNPRFFCVWNKIIPYYTRRIG